MTNGWMPRELRARRALRMPAGIPHAPPQDTSLDASFVSIRAR